MTTGLDDGSHTAEYRIDPALFAPADPTAAGRGWKEARAEGLGAAEELIAVVEATGCREHQLLFHRGDQCYVVRWR